MPGLSARLIHMLDYLNGSGLSRPPALYGNVLVVDDEPTNRLTLRLILEKSGCTVTEASNGADALVLAQQNPPDLALIDVVMPDMNGFEVCRQIKENKTTHHTPVIMVTSLQNVKDLETGFNAGASDYVTKPFRARELLARVRNSLILKQSTDALRRQQRQLSREIELAGTLQKTMLELPPFLSKNLLINYEYRPSMNVSGDVFDQVLLPDGSLCVYLADAAGHGVSAALMSSFLKSATRDVVRSHSSATPAEICEELNTRFLSIIKLPTAYATMFLGIFNPFTSTWNCMNCGHPSPILVEKDGTTRFPFDCGGGLPIGLAGGNASYAPEDEVSLQVKPGDTLFFYTDGLNEARHKETGEECGLKILAQTMAENASKGLSIRSAGNVISLIHDLGYAVGEDDCSVACIQMLDSANALFDDSIPAEYEAIQNMSTVVEKALLQKEWPAECAMSIQLLLMEHCNNTLHHGKLTPDQSLRIHVHTLGSRAIISVNDPGAKWDYHKNVCAAETMTEGLHESGRGIAIIRRIILGQEYIYFRDTNQNAAFFIVEKTLTFKQPDSSEGELTADQQIKD